MILEDAIKKYFRGEYKNPPFLPGYKIFFPYSRTELVIISVKAKGQMIEAQKGNEINTYFVKDLGRTPYIVLKNG